METQENIELRKLSIFLKGLLNRIIIGLKDMLAVGTCKAIAGRTTFTEMRVLLNGESLVTIKRQLIDLSY